VRWAWPPSRPTGYENPWRRRREGVGRLPLGAEFHRRRLTIRSTQVSTIPGALHGRWDVRRRRDAARGLLGELPLAGLATREFAFTDAPAAYAAIDRGEDGLLHAVLRYE
jgi:hypothetical protein